MATLSLRHGVKVLITWPLVAALSSDRAWLDCIWLGLLKVLTHMTLMFQTLGYPPSLAVVTKNSGLCWKHCEQSIDSRGNGTRWQEIRLRMLWSRQGFPCPWLQLHSKSLWQNTCSLRSTDVFLRLRKDFWISSLHLRAFDAGKVLPKSSWGKFGSDSHCKLLSNENGGWWSLILSQFKGICLLLSSSSSSSSS